MRLLVFVEQLTHKRKENFMKFLFTLSMLFMATKSFAYKYQNQNQVKNQSVIDTPITIEIVSKEEALKRLGE